jgi:hypothetical protein
VSYFTERNEVNEEKLPPLPAQMENRKRWVEVIEENMEIMQSYQDKDYCQYVANKIKEDVKKKDAY